ncbi:MAG TPA: cyclopropane-fatty-acyl-phospholipid synthase family protein [Actinomycetes bacterium]|nr:cyclopropane-fatty-acyl-phospholipid synthase family protein [Actinomycetes bacterium]
MVSSGGSIADVVGRVYGERANLRFVAYDGSSVGPVDAAVTLEVASPLALQYVATAPSDLGLARAFVSGALNVKGDLHAALQSLIPQTGQDISTPEKLSLLRTLGPWVLRRPPIPAEEASPPWRRGLRHSKQRDAKAISHHYDVSNRFYEMVLGESMTYTCAVYPRADATLEEAQAEKYDLVARKLALEPGTRLLDVGCGWGGMVMHAAEHYGVSALGVTLSRRQAEWAQKAIAERGLVDRAEVRFLDYRDVPESHFDAISSIGLTEHIGRKQLASYFTRLSSKLRPEGRLLNHCITRPTTRERARSGGFIDRYVFPDGELTAVGTIVSAMQDHGFEPRHSENLREHYAMTLRDWGDNLVANWDEAVAEVGVQRAKVWQLYMAASRVGFDIDSIQLHQVLGVKLNDRGRAGMPLRPKF